MEKGPVQDESRSFTSFHSATEGTADSKTQDEPSQDLARLKDSRRAWVVCFAAFTIQVLDVGVLHVYGVFFVELLAEFGCSRATAAWVGSLAYGITMLFAILASTLINRLGARSVAMTGSAICSLALLLSSYAPSIEMMFLTFSVLYGLGASLAYTPTMCIADDYFVKYVTLATGIMTAGSSTGTLILSPLSQWLMTEVGWRNGFRILSGATLACVSCGWMFKPLVAASNTPREKLRKITVTRRLVKELQLWKNRVFVIYVAAVTSCQFGYYIPYVHLVSHAENIGLSRAQGSTLVMILGGATATGRMLFGKIVEYGYLNRVHMHQMSMVITGAACMILPLFRSFFGIICYVIVVGLVDGCYVVLLPVLTAQLAGVENRVTAWGFLIGIGSVTFTLGPPIAGWISDATGSYDIAFHVAGIPIVLGAVILFFIPWAQRTARSINVMSAAITSPGPLDEMALETQDMPDDNDPNLQVYSLGGYGQSVPRLGDEMAKIQTRNSCVIVDLSRQNVVYQTRRRCTSESAADSGVFAGDITRAIKLLGRGSVQSTAGVSEAALDGVSHGGVRRYSHSESTRNDHRLPEDILQAIAVLKKHSDSLANLNTIGYCVRQDRDSMGKLEVRPTSVTPRSMSPRSLAAGMPSDFEGGSLTSDQADTRLSASQPVVLGGSLPGVISPGPTTRGLDSSQGHRFRHSSGVDPEETDFHELSSATESSSDGGSHVSLTLPTSNANLPTVLEEELWASPNDNADHSTKDGLSDLSDELFSTISDADDIQSAPKKKEETSKLDDHLVPQNI